MAITIDNGVRLPVNVERGASGGPLFDTIVQRTDGGRIETIVNWTYPLYQWDVGYGIQTPTDFNAVRDVFIGARGQAYGFRFKDWADYSLAQQSIGTGDSTTGSDGTSEYQIYKRYSTVARNLDRNLTRPVASTVQVWVNSVLQTVTTHYTVDDTTGIITFTSGNHPLTGQDVEVACEFDVPVHFVTDKFSISLEWAEAGTIPSMMIEEVRE